MMEYRYKCDIIKNIRPIFDYSFAIMALSINYVVLNIFDSLITINIIQNGIGYEKNIIISNMIDIISIYPTMIIKMSVITLMICYVYKESRNPKLELFLGVIDSKTAILTGLVMINIIYVLIVINNIYVLTYR